jgi:hypothetical protein
MASETVSAEEKVWCQRNVAMLLSEYSYTLIQFWKYEECEEAIKEAFDLLGLDLFLAGKLGRRTKWQQHDIAQLVLDITTKTVEVKKLRDLVPDKGLKGEKQEQYVMQDDESILYEQPVLTEAMEKEELKEDTKNLRKLETHELQLAD